MLPTYKPIRALTACLLHAVLLLTLLLNGCQRQSETAAPPPGASSANTVSSGSGSPMNAHGVPPQAGRVSPQANRVAPAPSGPGTTVSAHEVRVAAGDVSVTTFLPLQQLAEALRRDHTRPHFRVNWSCEIGGVNYRGTAQYDRPRRTLEYTLAGGTRRHYHFSRVTPKILTKLANDYPGGGPDAGFEGLPVYGCPRQPLH